MCFICGLQNPVGLHMKLYNDLDQKHVVSTVTIPDQYQSYPGVVHGGIVATMLDEISCAAAVFTREAPVVTGELAVRYRRPCPVEVPIELTARITGEHPRYLVIEADLRRGGELLAHSTGKFFFAAASAP
jgi:acyl-coenzyme A thioesterase PaaI-like protein